MFCSSQRHDMSHSPSWSAQRLYGSRSVCQQGMHATTPDCLLWRTAVPSLPYHRPARVSQAAQSLSCSPYVALRSCKPLGMMYGHWRPPADDILSIRQSTAVSDHLNASLHTDGVSGSAFISLSTKKACQRSLQACCQAGCSSARVLSLVDCSTKLTVNSKRCADEVQLCIILYTHLSRTLLRVCYIPERPLQPAAPRLVICM